MPVEVIETIIIAASLLITLGGGFFAGFARLIRRSDAQTVQERTMLMAKIDEVGSQVAQAQANTDARFDKVDERFDRIGERIHDVQTELTEVKIAVARFEGPLQRLIVPR